MGVGWGHMERLGASIISSVKRSHQGRQAREHGAGGTVTSPQAGQKLWIFVFYFIIVWKTTESGLE